MSDDVKPQIDLKDVTEERMELARLITQSLSGHDNLVEGKVLDAVNEIDNCEGIQAWSEKLKQELESDPKRWYQRTYLVRAITLVIILLVSVGWLVSGMAYVKESATSIISPSKESFLKTVFNFRFDHPNPDLSNHDKWLLENKTFHPLTESYPHNKEVLSDEFLKQNASEYIHQNESFYKLAENAKELTDIGATVDPDNPWYIYQRVMYLAENAQLASTSSRKSHPSRFAHNKEMIAEAWDLLEQANQMKPVKYHRLDRCKKRAAVVSHTVQHDLLGHMDYSSNIHYPYKWKVNYYIRNVFDAKFEDLAHSGEKEEVQKWLNIYYHFLSRSIDAHYMIIDLLDFRSILSDYQTMIEPSLVRVGLDKKLDQAKTLTALIEKDKSISDKLRDEQSAMMQANLHEFGILAHMKALLLKLGLNDTINTNAFINNRNAEHAFATRYFAIAIFCFILFALVLQLIGMLTEWKISYFIGTQISSMLSIKDCFIIIVGGMLLPFLFYLLVNHSPILGARRWNVFSGAGISYTGQLLGMFLLQVHLGYFLTKWRLSVKSKGLVRAGKISALGMIGSVLLTVLSGLSGKDGIHINWIGYICIGCCLFAIFSGSPKQKNTVAVAAKNYTATLILLLVMIGLIAMSIYFHTEEKNWMKDDPILTFDPESYGDPKQTVLNAMSLKKQLQERLKVISSY